MKLLPGFFFVPEPGDRVWVYRFDYRPSFFHRVGKGFFEIDVLAAIRRLDGQMDAPATREIVPTRLIERESVSSPRS